MNVGIHELGHSMGWHGHSTNSSDVMYTYTNDVKTLTSRYKNHLAQVYVEVFIMKKWIGCLLFVSLIFTSACILMEVEGEVRTVQYVVGEYLSLEEITQTATHIVDAKLVIFHQDKQELEFEVIEPIKGSFDTEFFCTAYADGSRIG